MGGKKRVWVGVHLIVPFFFKANFIRVAKCSFIRFKFPASGLPLRRSKVREGDRLKSFRSQSKGQKPKSVGHLHASPVKSQDQPASPCCRQELLPASAAGSRQSARVTSPASPCPLHLVLSGLSLGLVNRLTASKWLLLDSQITSAFSGIP